MTGETIGSAGERAVLAALAARLRRGDDVDLGPGDDAAVIRVPDGRVVATTDLLVEGRHFRRDWSSAYDIGRKSAAQNLADVAAMGARPTALLVGLAAPPDFPMADVRALADGLQDECDLVGASVAGGDLVRDDHLLLAVTALGDLGGRAPVTRSGARQGDRIVVSGRLGWSAAGLALFAAGIDGPPALLDAHRRPAPPYADGLGLADAGATAMCDVSDGLLRDLDNLARASDVDLHLDLTALEPGEELRSVAAVLRADPVAWVLTGGEDHALVATLPVGVALRPTWRVVGTVAPRAGTTPVVHASGYEGLTPGWDSFASPSG